PIVSGDAISKIVAQANATQGATVGDAVVALKDALLAEPGIDGADEQAALEKLVGAPFGDKVPSDLETRLRALCGVYVSSPQFMLGGLVPHDSRAVPKLTPKDRTYDAMCKTTAALFDRAKAPYTVECTAQGVYVKRNWQ